MATKTLTPRAALVAELQNLVKQWCARDRTSDVVGTIECVKADFLSPGKSLVTTPFSVEMRELVARWCDQADFVREEIVGILEYEKFLHLAVMDRWLGQPAEAATQPAEAATAGPANGLRL